MDLVGDRRGQSIQVGAVLLFAALIVAFASYQAFVVPDQNREVEFNHNQEVQSDMQDLRNAIVSARDSGEGRSVSVQLGTRYPSRLVARNPSPPSGSLNTVGTTDDRVALRITNAQAAGETGDFWNESQRYNTGAITYRPNYNVYANPPTTTYEQSVLYNRFPSGNITLSNQSFIDGTDISLVAINGSLSASSTQTTSVDVQSVSSSTERVRLENDDSAGPLTITFSSQRSAAYWDFLEESQSTVDSVTTASSGNGIYNVSVALDPDRTYSLQLTKVGVGTGVTDEDPAYLTDVEVESPNVTQGETTAVTLEVRDRFNNPPDDAAELRVNGSIAGDGSFQSSGAGDATKTPDEDGQVTFVYEATGSADRQEIRFSYTTINGSFEASTPEDVSTNITVESPSSGGSGRLVSLNDGRAFDGNGNGVAGAFSVTVENQVGQSVELTDVAVVPENTDINGLSDESGGTAPGESELAVEDLSTGETRVVELSLFTGDQYGFVSGRGTVLSLESPMNEETYSVSSDSLGSVETELTGSVIELGTGESAEITFAEFWTVGGSAAQPANVSNETFRLAVTYSAGGSRVADEFVVNVAPPSASPGNSPPTADIAGPSSASVGDTVTFDASGSTDPDGDTLSYEWDTDDDGAFDDDTGETTDVTFSSSGEQTVSVRVNDGNGGVGTASETVTVGGGSVSGFSDASVTSILPGVDNQRQTVTFTPDSSLSSDESVEIDLSGAQAADQVDYSSSSAAVQSGPSGSASFDTSTYVITYSPGSDITAGETVELRVSSISLGSAAAQNSPYSVGFSRTDGGSTTDNFAVATDDGTAGLSSLSASNVSTTGPQSQTISFTLDSSELSQGEVVLIDLSDAQNPSAPFVDYANADTTQLTQGSGSVSFNSNNGDSATLRYTAGASDAASDTISVEFTGLSVDNGGAGQTFTVGFSREDADTASTTFRVNDPSAVQINNFQDFAVDPTTDEFTVGQVQYQADSNVNLERVEYVVTDSNGNTVASDTVDLNTGQYNPSGSPDVVLTGNFQGGETYDITATVYDDNGNFDSATGSATAPVAFQQLEATVTGSRGGGTEAQEVTFTYDISSDVTGVDFTVTTSNTGQTGTATGSGTSSATQTQVVSIPQSGQGPSTNTPLTVQAELPTGCYEATLSNTDDVAQLDQSDWTAC